MDRGIKPEPARAGGADVLVVGGGPGGSAAAIGCAAAGLRVVLFERDPPGRGRPGETLHPGAEPLLARLGVWREVSAAGFLRHEGHWVSWAGPARFEPFGRDAEGPWRGLQVWRAEFDAILLARARALGVDVRQPCRVSKPLVEGGRVAGVLTPEGAFRAPFVVDAAGGRRWLTRELGLPVVETSPRLVATYGYVKGECAARDAAPALSADRRGWTWTARVRPGVYAWTRLDLAGRKAEADWLPPELRGLEPLGPARAADVTWRVAAPTAGPGYFLVGDAASVLDPASSHGVLKAIMSGMTAARLIVTAANRRADETQNAQGYDRWLRDWFVRDTERLRGLYNIFSQSPKR